MQTYVYEKIALLKESNYLYIDNIKLYQVMQIITTKGFRANQKKYFDLAEIEGSSQ